MADDWDLYAVVRSYATAASSTIDAGNIASQEAGESENAPRSYLNSDGPADFPGFDNQFQGLGQIYQEQQYEYNNPTNSVVQEQQHQQQYITPPFSLYAQNSHPMVQQQQQQPQMILGSSPLSFASANPQPIRSRRRKNQQEKTVHRMTQEELSADTWAWRKYGQKPIKGSPYPRNYYRCSTSKGCVARRQVERCPTDPNMYVVSYSGQHSHPRPTHRSSLAGSTRTKSAAKSGAAAANNTAQASTPVAASSSSPVSGTSFSPAAEDGSAEVEVEAEEEVEGWDDDQDEDDDGDGDGDDDNGDDNGEILIPNPFIDHY